MLASQSRAAGPARRAPRPRWRPTLERLEDRTTPSGGLDPTFSSDGRQTLDSGADDRAAAVAVQADGKIVVAGSFDGGASNFAVARYLTDGTLDTSFSGDGKAEVDFGAADFCTGLAIQNDGKIVLVGYTSANGSGLNPNDFAVARLNADGSLDATFNAVTVATTSNGNGK